MSLHVHARKRKRGTRYKVWSTVSDSYVTHSLTKEELRIFLLYCSVEQAVDDANRRFESRVARAEQYGSSDLTKQDRVDLEGPWGKQRKEVAVPELSEQLRTWNEEMEKNLAAALKEVLVFLDRN